MIVSTIHAYRHSHWKHSPLWAYITFSTHSDLYWTGLSLAQQSSELMRIHCILHYITIICICLLSEPLCPALLWGCSVQWRANACVGKQHWCLLLFSPFQLTLSVVKWKEVYLKVPLVWISLLFSVGITVFGHFASETCNQDCDRNYDMRMNHC